METETKTITSDKIIDLRDVTDRVEHLEQLRKPGPVDLGPDDNEQSQDDLFGELANLEELLSELKGCGGDHDWRGDWYPLILIREDHMRDYAEELAEDCGLIQRDATWPNNCIDWDEATELFKQDYSTVEFDGEEFWYR